VDLDTGVVHELPPLWENRQAKADQKRFIFPPGGQRISCAATGSKTGKTWGLAEWVIVMASELPPGSLIWWVGPYWKTVNIGWDRVLAMLPPGEYKKNESEKTILWNGVRIEFRSAENPNTLYGEAVHACVVDEGPRMRREAWGAITTTMMQTRGPIRVAGNTDKGKNNWFYELYLRGVKGDPEVASWSIKTYENPHMNRDFIMSLRATYTERQWQSLVEAEFVDDGSAVFRGIENCLFDARRPDGQPWPENVVALPYCRGESYVLGADLGKYTDFTVLTALELGTRKVVFWDRFNQRSWPVQLQTATDASRRYGNAVIWMDTTGAGEPVFEQAQRAGIPVMGYKLSNPSKVALIEKLIIGIERADIRIPSNLLILREELASYEVEMTESGNIRYSSPGEGRGIHDDAVISLALAYWSAAVPFEVGYRSGEKRERRLDEEPVEPWIMELDQQWRGGRNPLRDTPQVESARMGRFGDYRGKRWR
jgi:hypothetical protein